MNTVGTPRGNLRLTKRRRGRRLPVVAALVAALVTSGVAAGSASAAVFVDLGSIGGPCSDTRTATQASSATTPWCSLDRAAAAAPSGSLVQVRAGSYPGLGVTGEQGRTATVTFRPYGSEAVSVAGLTLTGTAHLRFEGFQLGGPSTVGPNTRNVALVGNRMTPRGVSIQEGSSDVLVERNHISAPTNTGVFLSAGPGEPVISNVVIRGNHFDGIGASGVNARYFRNVLIEGNEFNDVRSWDGVVHPNVIRTMGGGSGLVVRGNFIHDNKAICFFIKDGKVFDVTYENNLVVRNECWGIQVYDVEGFRILNNTIWGNMGGVIFRRAATGVVVKNNILASFNVASASTQIAYENYNYIAGGTPGAKGANDLRTGIVFRNPAAFDYQLASNSVGIDAGTSDGTPWLDRLGRPRFDVSFVTNGGGGGTPFYDLGAYEFGAEAAPVPAPSPGTTEPTPTDPGTSPEPGTAEPAPGGRRRRPNRSSTTAVAPSVEVSRDTVGVSNLREGIVVSTTCHTCAVSGSAVVRFRGHKAITARTAGTHARSNGRQVARIRFSRRHVRTIRRLLSRGLSGRVRVSVTATDSDGSRTTRHRRLRLRR